MLLAIDLSSRSSFEKLNFWLIDLKENSDNFDQIFIPLICNKLDKEIFPKSLTPNTN